MPVYRIYRLDAEGHILAPPVVVDRASERAAVQEALAMVGALAVELWHGTTLIRRFEPVESPLTDSAAR